MLVYFNLRLTKFKLKFKWRPLNNEMVADLTKDKNNYKYFILWQKEEIRKNPYQS